MQKTHTLIIGSGAAGLCCAVRLKELGINDLLIATEGLDKGTSINTGSDKQTYYKLSLCGNQQDSVYDLAKTLFDGGSMHGDIALIEAAYSARCFTHLVQLGVKFPTDRYGQFAGYKTDHDPRQRATSTGPYTSRDMCLALQKRVRELQIPVRENLQCVELLTSDLLTTKSLKVPVACGGADNRCIGAVFLNGRGEYETFIAENIVFAVGGPGDMYLNSVYPYSQRSSIGLALAIGAEAHNLQESQFGLASVKHRWNVSGTYMQVIPRFVSTDEDGNDEREFLADSLANSEMFTNIFLKGYQWPFDVKKLNGSSVIDLLVHIETVEKKRRVFLDFLHNPKGLDFAKLKPEAFQYLEKSQALFGTPVERLARMNPQAIEMYKEHGIDLWNEPLEIAVCAQHNNGGLAGTVWWESTNIKHLFPIGEVNGSHGVARPGGAALNAGQVGAFRAAEYIASRYSGWTLDDAAVSVKGTVHIPRLTHGDVVQQIMSRFCGAVRLITGDAQIEMLKNNETGFNLAAYIYADAIRFSSGTTGSRGSALVLYEADTQISKCFGEGIPFPFGSINAEYYGSGKSWKILPEREKYREQVLVSRYAAEITDENVIEHRWEERRPIPQDELWFETAWKEYREGHIYD
ncbi:FAD-binding protein [Planctomycetales bacterium]|nr:FAD-binding protein [Planctomycetales bacterium]